MNPCGEIFLSEKLTVMPWVQEQIMATINPAYEELAKEVSAALEEGHPDIVVIVRDLIELNIMKQKIKFKIPVQLLMKAKVTDREIVWEDQTIRFLLESDEQAQTQPAWASTFCTREMVS